jgi:hypothetical protein
LVEAGNPALAAILYRTRDERETARSKAQWLMTHYDHPARIMAAESQIALLKAALREALDAWEFWHGDLGPQQDRIAALRKLLHE